MNDYGAGHPASGPAAPGILIIRLPYLTFPPAFPPTIPLYTHMLIHSFPSASCELSHRAKDGMGRVKRERVGHTNPHPKFSNFSITLTLSLNFQFNPGILPRNITLAPGLHMKR